MNRCYRGVWAVVLVGIVGVGGWAYGADDPLAWAPAESEVVLSINMRQVADAPLTQTMLKEFGGEQAQAGLQVLKNLTGVDVMKDLDRAVFWGRINDDDSIVLVFQGRLNQESLTTILKTNPQYAENAYKEVKVQEWFDKKENRMKFGAFLPDGSAVMANQKSSLEACIDARGKNTGFLASPKADLFPEGYKDATAWALVVKPDRVLPKGELKETLQAESAAATLTMREGSVALRASVTTATPEAAAEWQKLVQGVLALVQLQQQNQEVRDLAASAKTALDTANKRVTLELSVPDEKILSFVRKNKKP